MHTSHRIHLLQTIAAHSQRLSVLYAAQASGIHTNGVTFSAADATNIAKTWAALKAALKELEPEFRDNPEAA